MLETLKRPKETKHQSLMRQRLFLFLLLQNLLTAMRHPQIPCAVVAARSNQCPHTPSASPSHSVNIKTVMILSLD